MNLLSSVGCLSPASWVSMSAESPVSFLLSHLPVFVIFQQHDSPGPEENAEPGEVSLLWNPHSHTLEAKSFPSELSSEHPKEGARKAEGLLDLLEGPLVSVTGSGLGLDRLVEFWKISIPRSNLPAGSSQRVCCSWTGPFSSRGEKAVYPAPKEAFFSRGCQGGKQEEASGACPLLAPSRAR